VLLRDIFIMGSYFCVPVATQGEPRHDISVAVLKEVSKLHYGGSVLCARTTKMIIQIFYASCADLTGLP